jgi:hypothetical protein
MHPLPDEYELDAHLLRLEHQGFTLIPRALAPNHRAPIRARFDELIADHRNVPTAVHDQETGTVDLNRLEELDPVFECLMDLPTVFPIARAAMNDDITLLGGAIGQYVPAHTPTTMHWHTDGDYLRFTYLLDELDEDGGGTALIPGSHRAQGRVPDWFHAPGEEPREIPGMVHLTGPAGTCMINKTTLWHTRSSNQSDRGRRTVWHVFKRADQALTPNESLRLTAEYIERQTDPGRRALMGLAQ